MKLYELLEVIEDSQTVIISDSNNDEIARYDGRESIPTEYGVCGVIGVYAGLYNNLPCIRVSIYE